MSSKQVVEGKEVSKDEPIVLSLQISEWAQNKPLGDL
jgi:hypothetical protein